jgi:hypothetical protein
MLKRKLLADSEIGIMPYSQRVKNYRSTGKSWKLFPSKNCLLLDASDQTESQLLSITSLEELYLKEMLM